MPSQKTNALILGCRQARPTAKLMSDILGWDYDEGVVTSSVLQYRVIFRYGNINEVHRDLGWEGFTINPLSAIKKASDKLTCRISLLNNGVSAPDVWDVNNICDIKKFPVIARPFHHSQGRSFLVVENMDRLKGVIQEGFYAQEIVDKEDEFRMFIFNGAILEISQKVKLREDANMMIRNHRKGWGFKRIFVKDAPRELKNNAVKAFKISGLNFAAIDCATTKDGKVVVFEINSAPGLIERKAQKIAERINAWLTEEKGIRIIGKKPPHIEDEISDTPEAPAVEVNESPFRRAYMNTPPSPRENQSDFAAYLASIERMRNSINRNDR